jgi:putative ABC transport system permease protein
VERFLRNALAGIRSLAESPSRTALSALGIAVGAMAIVLLVGIARGVQDDISGHVEELGVNLLIVVPGRIENGGMFSPNLAGVSHLAEPDVQTVREVPGVRTASPMMFVGGGIRHADRESPMTFILAANSDWFRIRPVKLAEGRTFSPEEEREPVVVIGSLAKESLFGEASALDQTVSINGQEYRVVGVTQDAKSEESLFAAGSFENVATVPYGYARESVPFPQVHRIMIQTAPDVEPKALVEGVEAALARRLNRELYSVLTQEDLLGLVYKITGILTWLLTGLTSIALFVGGVGIMTVMLMSVSERSKEIGVRKASGAKRSDVFQQFLTEAASVSVVGGAAGLLASLGVCALLREYTPIDPSVTPGVVALALGVCGAVGIAFGILPAMLAARKDPVVALRHE